MIAAEVETFRESIFPDIGIMICPSQFFSQNPESPVDSVPIIIAAGPVKS